MDAFGYLFFNLFLEPQNRQLIKMIKFLLFFIIRITQSKKGLCAAANVQQHARLRQMILETFDDMSEFDYDVVYEDIIKCMEYETNVKQFFYFQSLLHSVAMQYKAKSNPFPLFIRS